MEKISYEQLPEAVQQALRKEDFLRAYAAETADAVVLWRKDPLSGRQREQEFSYSKAAFLSREEREQRFPPPELRPFPENLLVNISNILEKETDVRYEVYDIYRDDTRVSLASAKQIFYGPFRRDVGDVVKSAVAQASFPSEYARWDAEHRVNYWVGRLYRIRRQAGESAGTEDAALNRQLGLEMRALDPDIERLLPLILTSLASMEQREPRALARVFEQKTGLRISQG